LTPIYVTPLPTPTPVDSDNDGVTDSNDNCPSAANSDQQNTDGDVLGDICDPNQLDYDKDGTVDSNDNCISVPNSDQRDTDGDRQGDACDTNATGEPDADNDGIADSNDNCFQPNPDQKDTDGDSIGDVCDLTPGNTLTPTPTVSPSPAPAPSPTPTPAPALDSDNDGLANLQDNCPSASNPDQKNGDGDGLGDVCDTPVGGNCVEGYEPSADGLDCNPIQGLCPPGLMPKGGLPAQCIPVPSPTPNPT
jgi:hypothetical protein